MDKKIVLSNKEIKVKVLLEVLAVYAILALVFTGIYYSEPAITGFATKVKAYGSTDYSSDGVTKTILSLALILIIPLLLYKFVLFSGEMTVEIIKKIGEEREEYKKSKEQKQILSELKRKEKIKTKKEFQKKREGKSNMFVKCHKLLLNAENALQDNNIPRAEKIYTKSIEAYKKLDYWEKKEIYSELTELYNRLSK